MEEKPTPDPNNIRKMDIGKDFDQVKKIWLDEVKKAHKPFIPESFWDSKTELEKFSTEIKEQAKERYVYVNKDEKNKISGFIIAWPTPPETAYLAELYISAQYQRKGIGTSLFETLKGDNPKFPQLKNRYRQFTSSVYAHNYESFAWHIKHDFKVFGIRFCTATEFLKFDMIRKKEG